METKTKEKVTKKELISKEIASSELLAFINEYSLLPITESDIEENNDLKVVILAIQQGYLKFENNLPSYSLKDPLKNDDGIVTVSQLTFKTRIFPKELIRLSKGLNVSKDNLMFALRCMSYLCGETESVVNKFSKFDYSVIQQVSMVFM